MSGLFGGGGGGGSVETDPLAANLSFAADKTFTFPVWTPLSAPGAPTLGEGVGGNPDGAYDYVITFVTAFGETVAGTIAQITVSAKKVELTDIPLGPTGTTDRKIYRTVGDDQGGDLLLVAALGDNTTTVYTDDTADGNLLAAAPAVNTALTTTAGQAGYLPGVGVIIPSVDGIWLNNATKTRGLINTSQGWTLFDGDYGLFAGAVSYLEDSSGVMTLYTQNAGGTAYSTATFAISGIGLNTTGALSLAAGALQPIEIYQGVNRLLSFDAGKVRMENLPTTTDPDVQGALFTCTAGELAGLLAAGAKHVLMSKGV